MPCKCLYSTMAFLTGRERDREREDLTSSADQLGVPGLSVTWSNTLVPNVYHVQSDKNLQTTMRSFRAKRDRIEEVRELTRV